ncbi:MAG TPA: hypothetical protein VIH41_10710 [Myxococcales bacterium]
MRASAISAAILLCAAPAFAAPRSHAAAARKAERRGEWRKALREWKAAYAKEGNAEYLIAIGDAYSQLGNKAEARKSYEAYLADPLALPSRVEKVKTRIAQLEARNDSLALPALPLPDVSAVPAASTRVDPPLPRPAAAEPPPVALARAEPSPAPRKDAVVAPTAARESAPPLTTTPLPVPDKQVPVAAVSTTAPFPQPRAGSSRAQRTMAYVTASVAVAALGGGALAFTQANSVHGELTGSVHTAAETQRLLEDERRYRTLSLVGFAGGLIVAGIATALFVF